MTRTISVACVMLAGCLSGQGGEVYDDPDAGEYEQESRPLSRQTVQCLELVDEAMRETGRASVGLGMCDPFTVYGMYQMCIDGRVPDYVCDELLRRCRLRLAAGEMCTRLEWHSDPQRLDEERRKG